jgi:hypothetical protein
LLTAPRFPNKAEYDFSEIEPLPFSVTSDVRGLGHLPAAPIRAFLVLLHDVLRKRRDAQFVISSHSPILLGYPDAQIVSFDDGPLQEIEYEDTAPMQIVRRFVNDRDHFLDELFGDSLTLFDGAPE